MAGQLIRELAAIFLVFAACCITQGGLCAVTAHAADSAINGKMDGEDVSNGNPAEENAPGGQEKDKASGGADVTNSESETDIPEQPSYPGVTNKMLQKGGDGAPTITLYYPSLGKATVDKSIQEFIDNVAADYESDVGAIDQEEEKPSNYASWEMNGFFSISRPCPEIASTTFNIYSYSGGAHGNLLIRCLNYDLSSQKLLDLGDIFEDQQKALDLMSAITSRTLHKELGEDAEDDMIQSGTAPEIDNFSNLSLLKDGVLVEFQPYQVGPWAIGPQHVKIPLADMAEAKPSLKIWPQFAKELTTPATKEGTATP